MAEVKGPSYSLKTQKVYRERFQDESFNLLKSNDLCGSNKSNFAGLVEKLYQGWLKKEDA
ncbi:MAG: hypothetical protein JRJ20_17410 [Deltaproteobacteria bacterium]|nr:hypothetical protein [Deltaproteobacteria bacterium]